MMKKKFLSALFILCSIYSFSQKPVYYVTDFGAVGDGNTNNTEAIQKAVNKCSETGGRLVFPEGVFLSGTVYLASNITIELTAKAEWKGIANLSAYPLIEPEILSRMDLVPRRAMIYAKNKENITITGKGTIHPNGESRVFQNHIGDSPDRPFGIQMVNCKNITLSGLSMRNSAYWMQRYFHCDNLRFENLDIYNHSNLNNDGLDIDGCHKVIVSNCIIDASDDALVFKSEGMRTCEDVAVTNCVLRSQASALKLGTGSVGGFRYFTVSNCVIRPSESKIMNHPMGSWAGLVGIDLGNVDGGIMEHILVNNIVIDSIETPIFIRLGKRNARKWANEDSISDGRSRDIQLNNISGTAAGKISCAITAYKGNYIENVTLTNINLSFPGGGTAADVTYEVPEAPSSYPVNRMFSTDLPSYGFYIRHVKGLYMEHVQLSLRGADARPGIYLDDVHDMTFRDVNAPPPGKNKAAILINNSDSISVYGTGHAEKISDYLRVTDAGSRSVRIFNPWSGVLPADNPPAGFDIVSKTDRVNANILNWEKTTDDGGTGYYVIDRDGKKLADTRNTNYVDLHVTGGRTYNYSVQYIDGFGRASSAATGKIKTVFDRDKPYVDHIKLVTNRELEVIFDEPVDSVSAVNVSNYRFDPAVTISKAKLSPGGEKVTLYLDSFKDGKTYTLDISNIYDRASKPNTLKPFSLEIADRPVVLHVLGEKDLLQLREHGVSPLTHRGVTVDAEGNGACFSGDGSYIRIPDTEILNFAGDMAVSLWFRVNNPDADKYMRILSKRAAWNTPDGYELEINPGMNRINFSGGAKTPEMQGVITYHFDHKWHHLVAMIRNDSAIFYIDDKPAGSDPLVALPFPNQTDLYLGSTPLGNDNFDGCLGDVYLFSRSLSEEEISKLYSREYVGYEP